jgi:hypothetical protein
MRVAKDSGARTTLGDALESCDQSEQLIGMDRHAQSCDQGEPGVVIGGHRVSNFVSPAKAIFRKGAYQGAMTSPKNKAPPRRVQYAALPYRRKGNSSTDRMMALPAFCNFAISDLMSSSGFLILKSQESTSVEKVATLRAPR